MEKTYSVAGYVKLAKLWERSEESAVQYHHNYYENKFSNTSSYNLYDVYIDITGKKETYKRMEMVRLIKDCQMGELFCSEITLIDDSFYLPSRPLIRATETPFCCAFFMQS